MLNHVLEMTIYSHDDLGVSIRDAALVDVTNTIIFRALLCNYLMALLVRKWDSTQTSRSSKKSCL